MRVDPRHLRIALAVADHGTFNRAAAALGISQPALSKNIAQLERVLGTRLFDRGKRGTVLTEAGHILVRCAQNVESVIVRSQEEIRANANGVHGPLSIGVVPSMMLGLLPQALGLLSRSHREVALTVIEGLDGALLSALRRGDIELLLGPLEPSRAPDPDLVELPLGSVSFFIGVPRGHRLSGEAALGISELADEPWILPTRGSSFYRLVEALFLSAGASMPENAIATNSLPLQIKLVPITKRLCVLTQAHGVGHHLPFNIVPLVNAPIRVIGIRHLAQLTLSPLAKALVHHLQSAVNDLRRLGWSPGQADPDL
jgi:molybdate transport repressor ModE-like protein